MDVVFIIFFVFSSIINLWSINIVYKISNILYCYLIRRCIIKDDFKVCRMVKRNYIK